MRKLCFFCLLAGSLLGCAREKSTGDWVRQLKDPDASLRLQAIKALKDRISEAAVVPALTETLKDDNAFVRRDAALALGKIGPDARPALPALTATLKDREHSVRKAAADALKKIDPEAAARKGIK